MLGGHFFKLNKKKESEMLSDGPAGDGCHWCLLRYVELCSWVRSFGLGLWCGFTTSFSAAFLPAASSELVYAGIIDLKTITPVWLQRYLFLDNG